MNKAEQNLEKEKKYGSCKFSRKKVDGNYKAWDRGKIDVIK